MKTGGFKVAFSNFAMVVALVVVVAAGNAYGAHRTLTALPNATAPAPLMLASAQGEVADADGIVVRNDHTDLLLNALPGATGTVSFNLDQCQQPAIAIAPNGSAYLHDFSLYTCPSTHFHLTPVPAGVRASTVVSIGGSTFEVPALGAVDKDHSVTIGLDHALVNETAVKVGGLWYIGADQDSSGIVYSTQAEAQARSQQVRFTTFSVGNLAVDVYGRDGVFIQTEHWVSNIDASGQTMDIDQHELTTRFTAGYVVVRVEPTGFGPCSYCADGGKVYGLVTVATAVNSNSRSYGFGQ